MEVERGFDEQMVIRKCLLLGEEMGELFKAIRKSDGMKVDSTSHIGVADEELAEIPKNTAQFQRTGLQLREGFVQDH